MQVRRIVICLAGLALIAAACAPAAQQPGAGPGGASATSQETPRPAASIGSPAPAATAVADLARRLNVSASEIDIVSEQARVWGDGSLGCPQPGVNYTQIQEEGYQILLRHAGRMYDYRFGSSAMILCEPAFGSPQPAEPDTPVTPVVPIESGLEPLVDQARADLAQRLSVDAASVEVVSAEAVVWPDTSLGCPVPGMQYLQVLTEGARIELRVGNKRYAYHSGRGRGPFLCENPSA